MTGDEIVDLVRRLRDMSEHSGYRKLSREAAAALEQQAKEVERAKDLIAFIGPALLVLRNMLRVAKLPIGETKVQEMIKAVQDYGEWRS